MIDYVYKPDDYRKVEYANARVLCLWCGHEWEAVGILPIQHFECLECPDCHKEPFNTAVIRWDGWDEE